MVVAIKVRLYPNKKQQELINKTIGSCRFLYNQMLQERIEVYKTYKDNPKELKSYSYKTEKEYKELYPFLKEVSSRALQQSRINLLSAYKNFFRSKKGFPKFKSRHKSNWSYREPQCTNQIQIKNNKLKLLKLGWLKTKGLRKDIDFTKICSVTVSKNRDNKYYASILVEANSTNKERISNDVIGLDLGLTDYVITSKGQYIKPIRDVLKPLNKKLGNLQKHLARKVKDSKRRDKARIKVAELYKKISNIKDYFQWHLANKLCSENQAISLESLSVKNMIKNRKLSRVIQEASWSGFIEKLTKKAFQYDTSLFFQDRFFASTKTCYKCSTKNNNISLSDREITCPNCGFKIQRDLQAALNLEKQLSLEYSDYKHRESIRPCNVTFNLQGHFDEVFTNEVVYIWQ